MRNSSLADFGLHRGYTHGYGRTKGATYSSQEIGVIASFFVFYLSLNLNLPRNEAARQKKRCLQQSVQLRLGLKWQRFRREGKLPAANWPLRRAWSSLTERLPKEVTSMHDYRSYDDLPLVITVDELQSVLRIGRSTAYELVKSGKIPSFRVHRQVRISKQDLIEFMNSQGN